MKGSKTAAGPSADLPKSKRSKAAADHESNDVPALTTSGLPSHSGCRVLVDDVAPEPAKFQLLNGKGRALKTKDTATACSHPNADFVQARCDTSNALLVAAVLAFKGHHPLELTPDAIFSAIMAGVSAHVNADPERFRSSFVAHEGKKTLTVRDNSLVMGSWENRWERPVGQLGQQVLVNLSNESAKQVLKTSFSTTGPAQQAAHTMTFMDVVKPYFSYRCMTMCGIPHIDIAGSQQDWERLASAIGPFLSELGLAEWNLQLQTILGHFIAAFNGASHQDRAFWQGMLKYDGSGGSGAKADVTGWLA